MQLRLTFLPITFKNDKTNFIGLLLITVSLLLISTSQIAAKDLALSHLIKLDPYFSHHLIIAEKLNHQMHLYELNSEGKATLLKTYKMATGKKAGDKLFKGDYRTPEGIYLLKEFISRDTLIKKYGKEGEIYGVGAFVMDYPNIFDRLEGKTGGGIWVHSTNDETRIEKGLDSRGCLVIANSDLKDLAMYIELDKTQIIVTQSLSYLSQQNQERRRKKVLDFLEAWKKSWEDEDLKNYMSSYSKEDFKDPKRGSWNHYKSYKKKVFATAGKPQVNWSHLNVLLFEKTAYVSFVQDYFSSSIQDKGIKRLYLKMNDHYEWSIIKEDWSAYQESDSETNKGSNKDPNQVQENVFLPSQRFFAAE